MYSQPGEIQIYRHQLVGFFIDGLKHDYMKLKVMRHNPRNLEAALDIAIEEQNLRKRFELRNKNSKFEEHCFDAMEIIEEKML